MKCFSIVSERKVYAIATIPYPIVSRAPELYPEVKPGIVLIDNGQDATFSLGSGLVARVNPRLLAQDPAAGHIERKDGLVTILRASLVKRTDETLELIPERPDDESGALVVLDVSRGVHSSVHYQTNVPEVLLRTKQLSDTLFGNEETALVLLRPGRAFTAYRSDRRYLFFGPDDVQEELQISFDGDDVSYSVLDKLAR